jgi:hypothetical protein
MTDIGMPQPPLRWEPQIEKDMFRTPGFAWRVGLSILVVFGWLAYLIIWLFFYAGDFGVFQNIAIFLVSIIVAIGVLAAAWATWGIRYAKSIGEYPHMDKPRGATIVSAIAGVGWVIFLIIWLFYYAGDYTGYQNLAILIASLLVLGAVTGSAHALKWLRIRTA